MRRQPHPVRATAHELTSVVSVTMLAAVTVHLTEPSAAVLILGLLGAGAGAAATLRARDRRTITEPVVLGALNARVAAWYGRAPLPVHLTSSSPGHAWLEDGRRILVDRSLLTTPTNTVVGVLAHEYGHASEHHGLNRLITFTLLAAPAACGWIRPLSLMTAATAAAALLALLARRGLSRRAEYRADAVAVAAGGELARAGLATNLNPLDRCASVWHTHPCEAARLARLAGLTTANRGGRNSTNRRSPALRVPSLPNHSPSWDGDLED